VVVEEETGTRSTMLPIRESRGRWGSSSSRGGKNGAMPLQRRETQSRFILLLIVFPDLVALGGMDGRQES
jgi:hypothetical protein